MIRSILILTTVFTSINLFGQDTTETIVTTEGFYGHGWEYSDFMEIENDNLYQNKIGWLEFGKSLSSNDSLKKIISEIPSHRHVYLKIEAIKRTGRNHGHFGAANIEFEVIRIIEIDSTYTVDIFFERKRNKVAPNTTSPHYFTSVMSFVLKK